MQPSPLAIGAFTGLIGDYYFGAMLNGIHRVTRQAAVPLLVVQSELRRIHFPCLAPSTLPAGSSHPGAEDTTKLAALVATGLPVITVATVPEDVACSSVVVDNRGETRALVHHLIDHGHRHIAYIDHGNV